MLGVMIDCSRNAVMKPEKVKQFADVIKKWVIVYSVADVLSEKKLSRHKNESGIWYGQYVGAKKCGGLLCYDWKAGEIPRSVWKLWFEVNKPYGFDIQDLRIGGVLQRAKADEFLYILWRTVDHVWRKAYIAQIFRSCPRVNFHGLLRDRPWHAEKSVLYCS